MVLGLVFSLGLCLPWPTAAQVRSASELTRYRSDRILVKPKSNQTLQTLANLHATQRGTVLYTFPKLGNLQVIGLPSGMSVKTAIQQYERSGRVEFAEPDYWVHASIEPNDPEYVAGTLWGLHNFGQVGGTAGVDIDAPAGWDTLTSASNVIVAIIDSGANYYHEDLASNIWVNPGEIPGNYRDDDHNGFVDDVHGINAILDTGDPSDDYGHGTHLAGIIGAVGNNGLGVTGVAWHVQLMICKFLDNQGNGSVSDAIKCLDYARSKGASIINTSWNDSDYSESLYSAILRTRDAGIIVVASAGNSGQDNDLTPSYPASFAADNIVSVTAINRSGTLPRYSSYGATSVHLAAPGSDIYSTWPSLNNTYTFYSGTSMAAAYVSGVFALLRARFPDESYAQLITRVLTTTKPLASLTGKCLTGGMVSLKNALGPNVIADFSSSPSGGQVPLTVQFTNTSVGTFQQLAWDFGDGSHSTATNPVHQFTAEGDYRVTLTLMSSNGVTSTRSRAFAAVANYEIIVTNFAWIDPTGMTRLVLAADGISPPQSLPFPFVLYGRTYDQLYVGANGLLGFAASGLDALQNTSLPKPAPPHTIVCPYWDELSPESGGSIFIGVTGTAPNRQLVVSWVGVPRSVTPAKGLTFQVVLEESSQRIRFQYLEVQPDDSYGGGRAATIGLENETGLVAAQYAYAGTPASLTNRQALAFVPISSGGLVVSPVEPLITSGPVGGPFDSAAKSFLLGNWAVHPIRWMASHTQDWLSLSATNGMLEAGQTTNLFVTINTNALGLIAGDYGNVLSLTNQTDGIGATTRSLNLRLWIPQPLRLTVLGIENATLRLHVSGNPGTLIRLENSTNLSQWHDVLTNTVPITGGLDYPNLDAGGISQHFYRAAQVDAH